MECPYDTTTQTCWQCSARTTLTRTTAKLSAVFPVAGEFRCQETTLTIQTTVVIIARCSWCLSMDVVLEAVSMHAELMIAFAADVSTSCLEDDITCLIPPMPDERSSILSSSCLSLLGTPETLPIPARILDLKNWTPIAHVAQTGTRRRSLHMHVPRAYEGR